MHTQRAKKQSKDKTAALFFVLCSHIIYTFAGKTDGITFKIPKIEQLILVRVLLDVLSSTALTKGYERSLNTIKAICM